MKNTPPSQPALNDLAAALVERLEKAEYLAIRAIPTKSSASRKHVAQLRRWAEDAATLAAAIAILVDRSDRSES